MRFTNTAVVENGFDGLPEIVSFKECTENMYPLAEELIEGALRKGHKMLISGTFGAGRPYLLIELAVAITEGMTWLGFQCRRGDVLYVCLETDGSSFKDRLEKVYRKMAPEQEHRNSLRVWELGKYLGTLDGLGEELADAAENRHLDAIIIDPICSLMTDKENSADGMVRFCNHLDQIADRTGASVIYCHDAGDLQTGQAANSQMTGSEVMEEDPDALLRMFELKLPEKVRADGTGAFRVEPSLREFPSIRPFDVWFERPIHRVDTEGALDSRPADRMYADKL